jgi:hypothetical protein
VLRLQKTTPRQWMQLLSLLQLLLLLCLPSPSWPYPAPPRAWHSSSKNNERNAQANAIIIKISRMSSKPFGI